MEIIFGVTGNTLIAEFLGELDHHSAETARERVDSALENYKASNLIFDFSGISFMDSSGIGMILGRYRRLCQREGRIAIAGCSKAIRNILNMAGIFSIIDYYSTREEAVEEFGRKEVS